MTIPTNVIAYLRQQAPHAYCDECIGQKLGARGAQAEAEQLGTRHFRTRQLTSGQVHRESFEISERAMVQSAFVRGAQDHAGSLAGLKCFLPTRCTEAPTVAGFQAAKAELWHRRRKIVATGFGKREKRGGHDDADGVATDILSPSVAAAVSKEARHGVYRTELKPVTEHVTGCVPPTSSITAVVPQHGCLQVVSPTDSRRPFEPEVRD